MLIFTNDIFTTYLLHFELMFTVHGQSAGTYLSWVTNGVP